MNKSIYIILIIAIIYGCETKKKSNKRNLDQYEPFIVGLNGAGLKKNKIEIDKTNKFLTNIDFHFNRVYPIKKEKVLFTVDSIPYLLEKRNDTLVYSFSIVTMPTSRDGLKKLLKNKTARLFYADKVNNDGRINLNFFDNYKFLKKKGSVFYIKRVSRLSKEKQAKLYSEAYDAEDNNDSLKAKRIYEQFKKSMYNKYDLLFDIEKIKNNKFNKTEDRNINSIQAFERNNKKYYKLSSTCINRNDIDIFKEYIIDENLDIIKIGSFILKDYE